MIEEKIMQIMDTIEYGFPDSEGNNLRFTDPKKWDEEIDFYYLLTPEELLENKCGVCWDQVELERKLFNEENVNVKTYFIYAKDGNDLPCHTFLTYEKDSKYYWFEHSWGIYRGIHEYPTLEELLKDVKNKFLESHNIENDMYYVYQYEKPPKHIRCWDFYKYCENGVKIDI